MKKLLLSLCCIATIFSMSQCSKDPSDLGWATGEFNLSLNLDPQLNTRAGNDYNLDVNDFMIEVINSEDAYIKRWESPSEMPESVRLNVGKYKLRASYGSRTASGFSAWYFVGEEEFEIKQQVSTPVSVTCTLGNVKVAIAYGDQLLKDHKDYTVEVIPETGNPVIFKKDETRAAYIPAGEIRLNINLTDIEGASTFYKTIADTASPRDFVTFKLDTKEAPGNLILTVTTNTETDDRQEVIEIPGFMLPKEGPSIGLSGIDAELNNRFIEGENISTLKPVFHIDAEGGIKSAILKSDYFAYWSSGKAQYDLCNLTDEEAEQLTNAGLRWNDKIQLLGITDVDMSDFVSNIRLNGGSTNAESFDFYLEVEDNFLQTAKNNFRVTVTPPEFSIDKIVDIQSGVDYIYTHHVLVRTHVTKGNPEKIIFKVNKVSTGETIEASVALVSTENGVSTWRIGGLEEQTDYTIQPFYHAHYKDLQTIKTDKEYQIPNSSFDDYYEYTVGMASTGTAYYIDHYYWDSKVDVEAGNSWWATRNPASGGQDMTGDQNTGAFRNYTERSPRTSNNGTIPHVYSSDNYGVLLRTTGWGKTTYYYTTGSGKSYNANITAGLLFLGEYDCVIDQNINTRGEVGTMTSETINQGRPFTGRPISMTFQYSYVPYQTDQFLVYSILENRNGNNVEIIAEAYPSEDFVYDTKGNIYDAQLYYNYRRTDLKPTHIRMLFASSNNLGWKANDGKYEQNWNLGIEITDSAPPLNSTANSDQICIGSVLILDNLELNYNFE